VIEHHRKFEQRSKWAHIMLRRFLVGGGVSVVNIAIQALERTAVVGVAQIRGMQSKSHSALLLMAVMIPTVLILLIHSRT